MVYQGSKRRIAKDLKPILEQYLKAQKLNHGNAIYVEPFVGGANMIINIDSSYTRVGYDRNAVVIELLKRARNGEIEELYNSGWFDECITRKDECKANWLKWKETDKKYRAGEYNPTANELYALGVYGYLLSWSSKYFTSFMLNAKGADVKILSTARNIIKQGKLLKDITLIVNDYRNLNASAGMVIYCDPPYVNTSNESYGKDCSFNIDEFEAKCEEWTQAGAVVLLSELTKYSDKWQEIWSKEIRHGLVSDQSKTVKEKLFIYIGE